jgi:S-adenosylmethionine-diacylgycerolhomoserine-N-methlytransferase
MPSAAESMDRIYRYQRFIYDVTRRHFLAGRDTLIEGLAPAADAVIVEIGCGTARNLIRIAERYSGARLCGIDVSSAMLATAARRVSAAGLAHRIRLGHADAAAFDPQSIFGFEAADRVVISYAISMIPAWRDVLARSADLLRMNGSLHVVDFGPCDSWPYPARSLLDGWLARFSVTPRLDLAATLRDIAESRGLDCFHTHLYGGYAAYGVLTRR